MVKFSRELLVFLVLIRVSLWNCAEFSDKFAEKLVATEKGLTTSRSPFDPDGCQDVCDFIDQIMSGSATSEELSSDLMNSQTLSARLSPTALPVRFSLGSSTDFTTIDGGSQIFEPPRKYSMDSSYSEVVRSKFHSICEADEVSENMAYGGCALVSSAALDSGTFSDFLTPTVFSETVSDNSDAEENAAASTDCFDGWPVHHVSMEWISSTFIPYLRSGQRLLPSTNFEILDFVREIFTNDETIVNLDIPEDVNLIVVGDIHGQFEDLIRIFEQNGYPSPTKKYIFNGDIVDRGPSSVECLMTLFLMKICYPRSVFITRGNHESHTCGDGTFKQECYDKAEDPMRFFMACHEVFNVLPLGYIIQDKFFVCHGGLPDGFHLDMIRDARRPNYTPLQQAVMMSMMWNDPHEGLGMRESKRGGLTLSFGYDVTFQFLARHGFSLLIRSHEYHMDGYFYSHDGHCLTIFSAPNYCRIGNKAVVMSIKHDLSYEIVPISIPEPEEECVNHSPRFSRRKKERSLTLNLDDADYVLPFSHKIKADASSQITEEGEAQVPKEDETLGCSIWSDFLPFSR